VIGMSILRLTSWGVLTHEKPMARAVDSWA